MLAALVAVAALAGGWWALVGRYTDAPAVVGLTESEARDRLISAGFDVEERPAVHSDEVPEEHVVDQDPVPDGRVVEGGTITPTSATVVWRTRILEDDEADVAAELGVGVRTLQRRRQRTERELARAS